MTLALRIDLVSRVVDHFGDAGFALRLARQLVREHAAKVTLWIDDLRMLARIAPGIDAGRTDQSHDGYRVRALDDAAAGLAQADVVIELFGCGLPGAALDAMAARSRPPVWIVLEYLTAETWADGAHGKPSQHPALALPRWFFLPGFTSATGGLLREQGLTDRCAAFRRDPAQREALWRSLGLSLPVRSTRTVSLFCYPNPALCALFERWSEGETPLLCVVPQGVAEGALDRFLDGDVPHAGEQRRRGALQLAVVPFVDQDAFDRRLWACDVAIVRGEDSFVRAQWAARPFAWHIYPQEGDAHRVKLDAFLARYLVGLAPPAAAAVRTFWQVFNEADALRLGEAWDSFTSVLPALNEHAARWARSLGSMPDLSSQLVEFARNRL